MNIIKIAAGQFVMENNLQKNKKSILKLIQVAIKQKARILLLPECALIGRIDDEFTGTKSFNQQEIDAALLEIGKIAKLGKIFVAVGTALYNYTNKTWTNSLVIINSRVISFISCNFLFAKHFVRNF